jgi:hypothetical protein
LEAEAETEPGLEAEAEAEAEAEPGGVTEPAPVAALPEPLPEEKGVSARVRRWGRARLRLRSAVTLVVLVTFVGILLAVVIGALLTWAAQALRQSVG